jgi:hypothetical protein
VLTIFRVAEHYVDRRFASDVQQQKDMLVRFSLKRSHRARPLKNIDNIGFVY